MKTRKLAIIFSTLVVLDSLIPTKSFSQTSNDSASSNQEGTNQEVELDVEETKEDSADTDSQGDQKPSEAETNKNAKTKPALAPEQSSEPATGTQAPSTSSSAAAVTELPKIDPNAVEYEILGDLKKVENLMVIEKISKKIDEAGAKFIDIKGYSKEDVLFVTEINRTKLPTQAPFNLVYPIKSSDSGKKITLSFYLVQSGGQVTPFKLKFVVGPKSESTELGKISSNELIKVPSLNENEVDEQDAAQLDTSDKLPLCAKVPSAAPIGIKDQKLFFDPLQNGISTKTFYLEFNLKDPKKWIIGEQQFVPEQFEVTSVKKDRTLEVYYIVPNFLPRFREMTLKVVGEKKERKINFIYSREKSSADSSQYLIDFKFEKSMSFQFCGIARGAGFLKACSQSYSYRSEINKINRISSTSVKPNIKINKKMIQLPSGTTPLKAKNELQIQAPNGARLEIVESITSPNYYDFELDRETKSLQVFGKSTSPVGAVNLKEGSWKLDLPYKQNTLLFGMNSGLRIFQKFQINICPPTAYHRVHVSEFSAPNTYLEEVELNIIKNEGVQASDQMIKEEVSEKNPKEATESPQHLDGNIWNFKTGKKGTTLARNLYIDYKGEKFKSSHKIYRGYSSQALLTVPTFFNLGGLQYSKTGVILSHWFERAFGSKNPKLFFQKMGIEIAAESRLLNFGDTRLTKEINTGLTLNYRFLSGVQYKDPSANLNLKFSSISIGDENLSLGGFGFSGGSEPFGIIKLALDLIPFLNYPRWFSVNVEYLATSKKSQNFESAEVLSVSGGTSYFLRQNTVLYLGGIIEQLKLTTTRDTNYRTNLAFQPSIGWLF